MPDRHSPMRTGRFSVDIDDVEVAGFRTIDLPTRHTGTEEFQEGEESKYNKQLWGQTTYEDLEMERGLAAGQNQLLDWRRAVEEGRVDEGRKKVVVTLMDETGQAKIRWEFSAAWPKEYHPPELDAGSDGELATEAVTIAFDKMVRTQP